MDPRCLLRNGLIGTALAVCATLPVHAQLMAGRQISTVQTVTASSFLNGGIGVDEQAAMHSAVRHFPLRISFSERQDGEFLADIPMAISDANGNSVFELRNAGPLLYVMLPPGRYSIRARFKGETQTQKVTLAGTDGRDLRFHWEGDARDPVLAGRAERIPASNISLQKR